jgi:hypothetical protein
MTRSLPARDRAKGLIINHDSMRIRLRDPATEPWLMTPLILYRGMRARVIALLRIRCRNLQPASARWVLSSSPGRASSLLAQKTMNRNV